MNTELERIWKEMVVSFTMRHLPGGTEENNESCML
jgi:hypothetical protein